MKIFRIARYLITLLLGLAWLPAMAAETKPNIIVILADDLGRAECSAYGTQDIRTPHIDRLFKEGITFNNFRANSCVCSPTRAALLTGCYPDRVGVPGVIREEEPANSWGYLSTSAQTLPQVLKPAGYHSAIIGKWHLGITSPNQPTERGFDLFHGFLGDMMDDYYTHLRHGQNFMRHNQKVINPQGHATDLFSTWACDYLTDRAAGQPSQPFFLYLAYNAPHDPIQPTPEWLAKVQKRQPAIDPKRAKLVALIEQMDDGIGRVLTTLDKLHLTENTLVIFTSDNGGLLPAGANNGPWRSGKTHMYEGGLRVLCAARWPGHIQPGSQTNHPALSMDIFPTACAAAGLTPQPHIDAASFLPTLLGQTQSPAPSPHYFVRREGGPMYGGKTIEALIDGDWKILQNSPFAPQELYNLKQDPHETHDLAAQETKTFRELATKLRLQIQRASITPWQRPE